MRSPVRVMLFGDLVVILDWLIVFLAPTWPTLLHR